MYDIDRRTDLPDVDRRPRAVPTIRGLVPRPPGPAGSASAGLMALQRTAGNGAVSSLLALQRDESDGAGFFDQVAAGMREVVDTVGETASDALNAGTAVATDIGDSAAGVANDAVDAAADAGTRAAESALDVTGAPAGTTIAGTGTTDRPGADGAGESQRAKLISQLTAAGRGIPASGVRLMPEELRSLNTHLANLAALVGTSAPTVSGVPVTSGITPAVAPTPFIPVAAEGIVAALEALGAAIAAATLGELLLVLAVIAAILLLIIALLRNTTGRPVDLPIDITDENPADPEQNKQKDPEGDPKPDLPPVPIDPPLPNGGPRVFFGPVRAPNTPPPMPDRLPDGGVVPVTVTVIGWSPPMGPITVVPAGQGPGGTATVDGAPATEITGATTSIDVGGIRQTGPNLGTPLRLTATLGASVVGQSVGFAVAAIMQDMTAVFEETIDGASVGMFVSMRWRSDGKSINSLDEIEFEEQLQVLEEDGCFTGVGEGGHGGLLSGAVMPATDQHASARTTVAKSRGHQVVQQVWGFLDNRTGSIGMSVRKSGFLITRDVVEAEGAPGSFTFLASKRGRSGSARGHTAEAGDGGADVTIPL